MEYCYVWNRLDTRFALSAFQLTPLGQSTEDNGCSLWPTAHANCSTGAGTQGRDGGLNLQTAAKLWPTPRKEGYDAQGAGHGDLVYEVKNRLWPTPCAQEDGKSPEAHLAMKARMKGGPRHTVTSLTVAAKLWPTPTVPNGGRRNPEGTSLTGLKPDGGKAQIDLREFAIRLWPTPIERDWKSTSHANKDNSRPLSEVAGLSGSGSLNPRFVEELMGFPIDHTALKPSGTP
jgi:hypothetical protein